MWHTGTRPFLVIFAALLGACGIIDPKPVSDIAITYDAVAPFASAGALTGILAVNGRIVVIDDRNLRVIDATSRSYATPVFQLGDGPASFTFELRARSGAIVASGTVTHTIGKNSTNSFAVHARPTKRADFQYAFCGGPLSAFAVTEAGRSVLGDSLFVQSGGIPKDAVC